MVIQASVPCLAIAQTASSAPTAAAGLVNSVSGNAYARSASGKEIPLKAGDVFGPGTTFRTGPDSNVVLLFADGQNVALSKDSELHIDAYRFDARDAKSNGATLGLTSGMMRFVTGAIHAQNQDALFISAGKVSIDILSKDVTAFVVEADPKAVGVGELAVIVGEVAIQTPVGPLTIIGADQFTRWRTGAAPSAPRAVGSSAGGISGCGRRFPRYRSGLKCAGGYPVRCGPGGACGIAGDGCRSRAAPDSRHKVSNLRLRSLPRRLRRAEAAVASAAPAKAW